MMNPPRPLLVSSFLKNWNLIVSSEMESRGDVCYAYRDTSKHVASFLLRSLWFCAFLDKQLNCFWIVVLKPGKTFNRNETLKKRQDRNFVKFTILSCLHLGLATHRRVLSSSKQNISALKKFFNKISRWGLRWTMAHNNNTLSSVHTTAYYAAYNGRFFNEKNIFY